MFIFLNDSLTSANAGLSRVIKVSARVRILFLSVLVRLINVMEHHHHQKPDVEERVYLAYFYVIVNHQKNSGQKLKQGRNLLAGADAKTSIGACLSSLLHMTCSAGARTQDHLSWGGPTYNRPGLSTSIIRKSPYRPAYSSII